MKKSKKYESGFGSIATVLILLIVVTLGSVGWYVYSQNKSDVTSSQAAESSAPARAKYLEIKEWRVRFQAPNSLGNVKYSIDLPDPAPRAVIIESSEIKNATGNTLACATGGKENVTLNRYKVGDASSDKSRFTVEDLEAEVKKSSGVKIGEYYYIADQPQYCNENAAALEKDEKAKKAHELQVELVNAIKTLEVVQ